MIDKSFRLRFSEEKDFLFVATTAFKPASFILKIFEAFSSQNESSFGLGARNESYVTLSGAYQAKALEWQETEEENTANTCC